VSSGRDRAVVATGACSPPPMARSPRSNEADGRRRFLFSWRRT